MCGQRRMARLLWADWKVTVTQITARYIQVYAEEHTLKLQQQNITLKTASPVS